MDLLNHTGKQLLLSKEIRKGYKTFLWDFMLAQGLVAQCFFDLLVRTLSPEDLNH